jgi:hypothetical protein
MLAELILNYSRAILTRQTYPMKAWLLILDEETVNSSVVIFDLQSFQTNLT